MGEITFPEPPPIPRSVGWRASMGYAWVLLLLGFVCFGDGLLLAVIGTFVGDAGPSGVMLPLGAGIGVAGAVLGVLGLTRISRRRRLLQTGRAVRGRITGVGRPKGINPPPVSIRFEGEDPMSLQPAAGSRWFLASRFPGPLPAEGDPCWLVFDEAGGRPELLAAGGFRAWDEG